MATAVQHVQTNNTFLRAIEGNMKWSGQINYNFVQLANADELDAFNTNFASGGEQPPMTTDLPAGWLPQIQAAALLYREFINVNIGFNDDINADYLIGQDASPGLGVATFPSAGQNFMAFNVTAAEHQPEAELGGGNDRFQTFIHEMGHSLGLGHPHDMAGGTTAPFTDQFNMPAPYQGQYTVMSYTGAPGQDPNFAYGRAVTPMAFDIAALQNMYGANTTTRTGNTTYRLLDPQSAPIDTNSADGTIAVGRAYYGIWDAGTTDTDLIRYDGNARALINLMAATLTSTPGAAITEIVNEVVTTAAFNGLATLTRTEISNATYTAGGFFSSVLDAGGNRVPGGFSIANGVTIENASGGGGNDLLIGNGAANLLKGNGGSDTIVAGGGIDTLDGGAGSDFLYGGRGDDDYYVDVAGDQVFETAGGGTLDRVLSLGTYVLAFGQQVEWLATRGVAGTTAINLSGNEFGQRILGNAGVNILDGRGGADVLQGLGGSDDYYLDSTDDQVLEAAAGGTLDRVFNSASFTLAANQEIEWLATRSVAGTTAINLTGNTLAQTINGNNGANVLIGYGGADSLFGQGGNDRLYGGAGNDILNGGADFDVFAFNTALDAATNVDTIQNYSVAQDTIWLDDAIFTGLALGTLAASAFTTGAAATDTLDRIIYNAATGALLFDADGSNAGAAVQFATIGTGLAMANTEFVVV